jgi:ligand-binding sensor domain-containing protein
VFAVMKGSLYRGKDQAAAWASPNPANWVLTSAKLPRVNVIAVSGASLFAGTDGGVFRSINNGASWVSASTGLPAKTEVRAMITDGTRLFVGTTDAGVFRSDDHGGHWAAVGQAGQRVSVAAVASLGKQLFAATEQWESPIARRAVVWKILL